MLRQIDRRARDGKRPDCALSGVSAFRVGCKSAQLSTNQEKTEKVMGVWFFISKFSMTGVGTATSFNDGARLGLP